MKKRIIVFWAGIAILLLLGISYFIQISDTSQEGLLTIETNTSLLGIIIFYNPFVLGLYVLFALILIVKGLKKK